MSDFASLPEATKTWFPRHGWTRNVSGIRQLRFPLLRLYQVETPHYEIYAAKQLAGVWLQFRRPYTSIRMLAVCLRDLNKEFRAILQAMEGDWASGPESQERDRVLTQCHEAHEKSEVLLISAFVLLRRLADQLIDATKPLLFEDWQSAPRQMKTAVSLARSGRLFDLKPRCKVDRLADALLRRTAWFDALRQDDGVRDILIHKEHSFSVGSQGTKPIEADAFSWRVTADLMRKRRGELVSVDVLPILRTCLEGLCDFMEEVYLSLNADGEYVKGDAVFLTGNDEDVTAFWPELERLREEAYGNRDK